MEELGFFGNPISTEFSTSERGQSASAERGLSILLVLFFKLYAPDLHQDTTEKRDRQSTLNLLLAEHQPRVRPAICTALLDRLAVVSRHMIV